MSTLNFNSHKFFVALPFGLIFLVNVLITQMKGFDYSGQLALSSGLAGMLTTILIFHCDIQILMKEKKVIPEMLSRGTFIILIMMIVFIFAINAFNLVHIYPYINSILALSAGAMAMSELLLSALLKVGEIKAWIFFRSLVPLSLIVLVGNEIPPQLSWLYSYVGPLMLTVLYLIYIKNPHIYLRTLPIKPLGINQSTFMLSATVTTLLTNLMVLFWLIVIDIKLGEFQAGIWINAYRIFALPYVFIGATFLPFFLSKTGDSIDEFHKSQLLLKFIYFLLMVFGVFSPILYFFGSKIFLLFSQQGYELDQYFVGMIILICFFQTVMQHFKHFFETVGKSLLFLFMLIFQLCVGYFIVLTISTESLNSIVEIILLITTFAFAIFSIMLFFILKIKNS